MGNILRPFIMKQNSDKCIAETLPLACYMWRKETEFLEAEYLDHSLKNLKSLNASTNLKKKKLIFHFRDRLYKANTPSRISEIVINVFQTESPVDVDKCRFVLFFSLCYCFVCTARFHRRTTNSFALMTSSLCVRIVPSVQVGGSTNTSLRRQLSSFKKKMRLFRWVSWILYSALFQYQMSLRYDWIVGTRCP